MAESFDVAIVGGGMVGASLATALRGTGLRAALIEAHAPDSAAQPSFDERTTALGNASRRIFEALGLWQSLAPAAAPITRIHVSDAGRFGFARLEARELGLDALGFVVPNRVIGRELWRALQSDPSISLYLPARLESLNVEADFARLAVRTDKGLQELDARLVVAADGAQSLVRARAGLGATVDDYGQEAIVASLRTDQCNEGTAFERFTAAGPMALLPLATAGTAPSAWRTLVWAARPEDAARLMATDDAAFLGEWQDNFGWRAGRATELGKRAVYPLALTRSGRTTAARVVLLGNAAQSLHPVAGQGFNLALRDAADLAELLVAQRAAAGDAPPDAGAPQLLAGYEAARDADREGVIAFTDTLVRMFSSNHPLVSRGRDAGLLLFDLLPPAKRALSRVSSGFGQRAPRLARGLALQ